MIRRIKIENFKSIDTLELDLGRVNVLIGDNGNGKTNILEAIGLASAAATDRLGHDFLVRRGIRMTVPSLMRSAFHSPGRPISLTVDGEDGTFSADLTNDGKPYAPWIAMATPDPSLGQRLQQAASTMTMEQNALLRKIIDRMAINHRGEVVILNERVAEATEGAAARRSGQAPLSASKCRRLAAFRTFVPQVRALRSLEFGAVEPIDFEGYGFFKLLKVMQEDGHLSEVIRELATIGMVDDDDGVLVEGEWASPIRMLKFRRPHVGMLDQYSVDDGSLLHLLFFCLLISEHTPPTFAVDNIDAGLHPRSCAQLTQAFVRLAKAHDKQVLLTAHNPGTIDGLDLADDEQRLFVVYMEKGRTMVTRAAYVPQDPDLDGRYVPLSELHLNGWFGWRSSC